MYPAFSLFKFLLSAGSSVTDVIGTPTRSVPSLFSPSANTLQNLLLAELLHVVKFHPMKALQAIADLIDMLNENLGRTVAWMTLAMVLITFIIVVLRYVFNMGWIAMQESVTYLHAAVFMLGAAYTLKREGHVRVDIFYSRMGERGRAWVDLVGALLLLLPVAGFILWVSWGYAASSWALMEGSREQGGLPGVFLLKSLIPLLGVLLLLQGISQAIRSVLVLAGCSRQRADVRTAPEV